MYIYIKLYILRTIIHIFNKHDIQLIFYAMRAHTSKERKKERKSNFFIFLSLSEERPKRGKSALFFFSEHNAFYGHESGACVCECE